MLTTNHHVTHAKHAAIFPNSTHTLQCHNHHNCPTTRVQCRTKMKDTKEPLLGAASPQPDDARLSTEKNREVNNHHKLDLTTKLLFGMPTFGSGSLGVVIGTSLLSLYNNHHVGPSFIAVIQFVAGLAASYLQVRGVGRVCQAQKH